jgi:AcrR family transcriptional regulator
MTKDKNTEERIYEAARKVFLKKGMNGARMQEIADVAGINKALLHYYFRTKEKLFEGIFNEVIMRVSSGIKEIFESDKDILSKLKDFVDIYIEVLLENRYLPLFILNEMNHNPERFSEIIKDKIAIHLRKCIFQLQEEAEAGLIRAYHPIHLLVNILGLIIFPFAAFPVMKKVAGDELESVSESFLKERKQEVYSFIENALKP